MYVGRQSSTHTKVSASLNERLMATSSRCNMQVSPSGIMAISVFVFFIDLRTSSALNESHTSTLLPIQSERVFHTDDTQSVISSVSSHPLCLDLTIIPAGV